MVNNMYAENVKVVLSKLPFRDAVLLHNEMQSQKPLSQEMQSLVKKALKPVRISVIASNWNHAPQGAGFQNKFTLVCFENQVLLLQA